MTYCVRSIIATIDTETVNGFCQNISEIGAIYETALSFNQSVQGSIRCRQFAQENDNSDKLKTYVCV
jgi:hypothetical protein